MTSYVHGYSDREAERLRDQAGAVRDLLHHDTVYPAGDCVLEAGCGVGAQTVTLARNSLLAEFISMDVSAASLDEARKAVAAEGLSNVTFLQADVFRLPFEDAVFDHVFVCFLLEHLSDPQAALVSLRRILRPGGTITVIEGDHGSCFFHPETSEARAAWQSLIEAQALLGGDSLIGRRLYPLIVSAGFRKVSVSPRMVYCDQSRPVLMDAFVRKTIIAMVEGARDKAFGLGLVDEDTWQRGIRDLHALADSRDGTFIYTFFKAIAVK